MSSINLGIFNFFHFRGKVRGICIVNEHTLNLFSLVILMAKIPASVNTFFLCLKDKELPRFREERG